MRYFSKLLSVVCFSLVFLAVMSLKAEHKYLKAFPKAGEGMKRCVIILPEKTRQEEVNYKVEISIGKVMETDGVNRNRIGGKIETKPLNGWGFSYYEVTKFGPTMSTLVGVPPGSPSVKKFVQGPLTMIGYNSRLPIVVYVPKNATVQYRIWKAQPKFNSTKEM